ncbi:hypothetical protein O4H66_17125 [Comamonadaceae bacterium G21597-S1]|nr:hypothetical protein [Comamonadaceae bacterium G21597-S1]
MRFELIRKTKATLVDIDPQSLKMGQTEVVPAVALTFKVTLANSALAMLDKALLPFLYSRGNSGAAAQATLEGVEVVSEFPSLTPAAVMLGDLSPKEANEQTGCKLHIHVGATGHADIKLQDGTATVKKLCPKEGGAVDFHITFYTSDVDAETLGELCVLKSHDLDIELAAPELISAQVNIEDADGGKITPIKGKKAGKLGTDAEQAERQAKSLAEDDAKGWPFPKGEFATTPEEALAKGVGAK